MFHKLAEGKYTIHTVNVSCTITRLPLLDFHKSSPTTLQAFGTDHVPVSIQKGDKGDKNRTKGKPFIWTNYRLQKINYTDYI